METGTLTWRTLTVEDAPALTRTWAAVEAVDRTGEHFSEENLREALEDESIDLGRDSLAAFAPDGEAVAFAWLQGPAEVGDLDKIDVEGAVLPAARAQWPRTPAPRLGRGAGGEPAPGAPSGRPRGGLRGRAREQPEQAGAGPCRRL